MHILYGAVTIDRKTYRVKVTVKRDTRNEELARSNGAYCFFQSKPAVNFDYEVPNSDGRLTIWQ